MTTGNIFDIQRYSIHDGDGIRTTVFLKGCPLRCKWCANPESWSASAQLFFSQARCIKCGSCAVFEGIKMDADSLVIQREKCGDIAEIAKICPADALSVKGKRMTIAEVMEEISKDIPFYEKSSGGITLSGGEPLLQADFSEQLLKACKEKKLHTIIETSGYAEWEKFERVIPYTDQFFYDIKLADNDLHQKYTGLPNNKIIGNLKQLVETKADVCVRITIIPAVNDNEKELKEIAQLLRRVGVSKYELQSFHQYGKGKYHSCGIDYEFTETETLPAEKMKKISVIFDKCMS